MLELIGYAGSALTIASFLVSGERKLRVLNLAATFFFVIYALGIGAPSVAILNIAIMVMHALKISTRTGQGVSLAGRNGTLAYIGCSLGFIGILMATQSFPLIETFSFAISLLLLYGLSQDGEERIRPVCMVSAFMFVFYAIAIGSIPLLVSNGVLSVVHVVKYGELKKPERKPRHMAAGF